MRQPAKRMAVWWLIAISALLIVTGIIMLRHVYDQYPAAILQNEDAHLQEMARSVDRNIESYVSQFSADLAYVTQRSGFLESEALWRASGETEQMLFRLSENLAAQNEMAHAMLALQDDRVFLSTDGHLDYYFPPMAGIRGEISLRPCIDGAGNIYFAFQREAGEGLSYAVLMDLSVMYRRVADDLTLQQDDAVAILDAGGQAILYNAGGQVRTVSIEEMDPESPEYSRFTAMLEAHDRGEAATFSRELADSGGKPYTARMTVLPYSMTENSVFTIMVSSNYDEVIVPLRLASIRLIAYGSMAIVGSVMLFVLVILQRRRNEENLQQLKVLQEQNEAIEKLNEQMRALAHHQRLETIGTLTSGIAHEFNNLLTPIMGYSLLTLEKLPEDDELYDNLLEIYNASRKAKELVSRLSTLARKSDDTRQTLISPDELVRRTISVAMPAKPKEISLITALDCPAARVMGSETQLPRCCST